MDSDRFDIVVRTPWGSWRHVNVTPFESLIAAENWLAQFGPIDGRVRKSSR